MIKPDGVQRGLIGEIVKRFEQKGFTLRAMKFQQVRRYATWSADVLHNSPTVQRGIHEATLR